jgi:hypothetical protein
MCYAKNNRNRDARPERIDLMGKILRIFIALVVILSFVIWARSDPAGAAKPAANDAQSSSVSAEKTKVCDDNEKRKDPRKDDDCDDDDGDKGTVKPPPKRVKICKIGTVSVGGTVTVQVKKLPNGQCVTASAQPIYPGFEPPAPSGMMFVSDVLNHSLTKKGALVQYCFAVPPGTNPGIYSYSRGEWRPAGGTISKGRACLEVEKSGTFALIAPK